MASASINAYVDQVERISRRGLGTEHSYRPALKTLFEALLPDVVATNEPRRVAAGAPDFNLSRDTPHGPRTIGHAETKDLGANLGTVARSAQLTRYRGALPNLLLTDYLAFRWYVDGELRLQATIGQRAADGSVQLRAGGPDDVEELLGAFLRHQAPPIRSARELAERMARLTHLIRDLVFGTLDGANPPRELVELRQAFAQVLLPDLTQSDFADLFAQTLAYGLFAARVNHQGNPGDFKRQDANREIPRANPFLRRLFGLIAGPDLDDAPFIGFVDELAEVLAEADLRTILAQFGRRQGREDPVVHFYETFLAAYDPRLRELRGVYYTPEPVVQYIVQSVDSLLRSHLAVADGLADTASVTYQRGEGDAATTRTVPRVLLLDPALGTGTFLYIAIDLIRSRFRATNNAGRWPGFVREQLLPRLFGFELLLPSYAMAHLKLGMQLAALDLPEAERADWAYEFEDDERLGVYLTNTLEQALPHAELLLGTFISEEANAASEVKRDLPIMVVLGNPPYSGHSANRGEWINELIQDYYRVDGEPLRERNPKWLRDDYVKFMRFGQWRIEQAGSGILAFITNHSYLDNPTFRGMRQQLMRTFSDVYVLDLHGSTKKRESAPDGSPDENVFDIQQGVAISLFVRRPGTDPGAVAVHHADLWGTREHKYEWLGSHSVESTQWTDINPAAAFYLFAPIDEVLRAEYQAGWRVTDAFPVNVLGFQTHRDDFAVAFDESTLVERAEALRSDDVPDAELRRRYNLNDNRDWQLQRARRRARNDAAWRERIIRTLYRPFDWRNAYFDEAAMDYPRRELKQHMLSANIALGVGRQGGAVGGEWSLALVAAEATDANVFRRGGIQLCPLYVYTPREGGQAEIFEAERRPNLAPELIRDIEERLGLTLIAEGHGDLETVVGPDDVLAYFYAILYSRSFRQRYNQFLRTDYPRIPITADLELSRQLISLGTRLVMLHRHDGGTPNTTAFPQRGTNVVGPLHPVRADVPGEGPRVYINGGAAVADSQYFDGVPDDVWAFSIGGHLPAQKWLADRRGRQLSDADLRAYDLLVGAVRDSISLMALIDEAIEEAGGWPLETEP